MKSPRMTPETLLVLEAFIEQPTNWLYGYELSRATGIKSGTLYPILTRLERYSLLQARWVATDDGVPPRHTYRLTSQGAKLAGTKLAAASAQTTRRQPAYSNG